MLTGPCLLSAQHSDEEKTSHAAHFHPNHVALFTGATSELKEGKKTHFTLGADYVRRLGSSGQFGVGGFAEVIFHDPTEWLFGAAGYFFPVGSFWLDAGAGVEFYSDAHGTAEQGDTKASFLLRFGAGYEIELKGFSVTPLALLDLVRDTESLVWGINVGKGF
jgi:hypothetical protein